ncbi:MAG TPA: TolC family protein, partial [Planctomycetota bacterium]|nr:TolC family protein [Planctomycetota bacterium]
SNSQSQPISYDPKIRSRGAKTSQESQLKLDGPLTLQDAIKLALTYNRDLRSVMEERSIAAGVEMSAFAGNLPSVQLLAGYTRISEGDRLEFAGTTVEFGALDNYSVDLRVEQPIYRGGAVVAQTRAAQLKSLIADRIVQQKLQETVFAVTEAYYEVLLSQMLSAASHDAVESAKLHRQNVDKKKEQGLATEYDQLRAEVEVANLEAEDREQHNLLDLKNTALLGKLDAAFDSRVTLKDALQYKPYTIEPDAAVARAFAERPDLQAGRAGIAENREVLEADHAQYYPQVNTFFQQSWQRPSPTNLMSDAWDDRWQAGLQLRWNLFDGLAREGQIRQDRARLQQRQFQQEDLERKIVVEIRQATLQLKNAEAMVAAQELNLQRAKQALTLAEDGVQRGLLTTLDLSETRTAVTLASSFYYRALFQHIMAKATLQRAMGVLESAPK